MGFASIGASDQKKKKRDRILDRAGVHRVSGNSTSSERRTTDRAVKCIEDTDANADADGQAEDGNNVLAVFDKQERVRAYRQIADARGFVDLQDVLSIEVGIEEGEIDAAVGLVDVGGHEGLATSSDKTLLLRQRSFVIKLKGGGILRFEVSLRLHRANGAYAYPCRYQCFSIQVREEWVGRLQALRTYWRRRAELDALTQMDLTSPPPRRPHPSSSHTDQPKDVEINAPPDPLLLGKIYNFCRIEQCRPIVASGRFYIKRGLRGMFKHRYLLLLTGTLLE
jgi:hypothetical protein